MHFRNVPAIGRRYWTVISIASVAGANLGDFLAHDLHLGHQRGLLPLALVVAAILLLERYASVAAETFYWLVILTFRTAATNLADLMTHDLKLGTVLVVAALAALLCGLVLGQTTGVSSRDARLTGVPKTTLLYWLAILTAGTLGTALADGIADKIGLGATLGLELLSVALGMLLLRRWRPDGGGAVVYWLAIVAVRTAGTTVGDLCADNLGLEVSTAGTLMVLVGTLLVWRPAKSLREA